MNSYIFILNAMMSFTKFRKHLVLALQFRIQMIEMVNKIN